MPSGVSTGGGSGGSIVVPVVPSNGGTGVANNDASTLTISGAFPLQVNVSASTAVTLPTSGTLVAENTSPSFVNIAATKVTTSSQLINNGIPLQQPVSTANSSTAYTVDPVTNGGYYLGLTLNGATPTITAGTLAPTGQAIEYIVAFIQDGTGGRVPTWSGFTWASGTAPIINPAISAVTYIKFVVTPTLFIGYPLSALNAANNLADILSASTARTNLGLAIGTNVQAYDATLTALAAYNTNGILTQTATDTFVGRTITGTSNRTTLTNGDGVAGNPTVDISASYVGQSSITTLGTIGTGVWNGTPVTGTYGGTGVNNGSSTITLAGSLVTSGANPLTLTTTGSTNVTLPTTGTLVNSAVTTLSSLTSVGTIGTGTWQGTVVGGTYGGTGVNNGASTITLGGNFITSGAFAATLTLSGTTNVTLPTTGTLTTLATVVSTANTWTAAQRGAFSTLTDAATVAVDLSLANNYNLTLGGNRTLGVPTNPVAGQTGVITVRQDITGSRTLAYSWMYVFPNGNAPVLSTAALTMDQLYYTVNAYSTSTVTVTIATPGVMTWTAHGLVSGQKIRLTTTGALPTGLAINTSYWVTVIDANTFNLSTSLANAQTATFIATSGSQSGTHTATNFSITISFNLGLA